MTADAGLASIQARFSAELGYVPDLEDSPSGQPGDPVPQDPMARLILALDRNTKANARHDAMLRAKAVAAYPIPIPAMPYTVVAGVLNPGAGFGGSQTMGPRTGEFWDVTRLAVDGLVAGGGQPAANGGSATNPGAGGTVATVTPAVAGVYLINWTVGLEGTVTAADANNMELTVGASIIQVAEFPGVVGEYTQTQLGPITVPAGSAVKVKAVGAASGVSAIYTADISLVPVADDQVTLYKRFGNAGHERLHTFTAPGSTPGPDWEPGKGTCVMRDGDALQLAAAGLSLADDSQVLLSGEAIRVEALWIGDYFL